VSCFAIVIDRDECTMSSMNDVSLSTYRIVLLDHGLGVNCHVSSPKLSLNFRTLIVAVMTQGRSIMQISSEQGTSWTS
jgi:hypothetical protein